jgi:hypothetical protein
LSEYATREKDVQKGLSRMPLNLSRMSESDLVNLEQFRRNTPVTTADTSDSGSNSEKHTKDSQSMPQSVSAIDEYRAYSVTGQPQVEMTEELEENIRHRGKAY